MIKLVATDMDGTFLKEDGTYDKDRLANLLPKLAEKGISRQDLGRETFIEKYDSQFK